MCENGREKKYNGYFQMQIAKNIFESKVKACLVSTYVSDCFRFATILAANFGFYRRLSIQNHAIDCFQDFAHLHQKLLCRSLRSNGR